MASFHCWHRLIHWLKDKPRVIWRYLVISGERLATNGKACMLDNTSPRTSPRDMLHEGTNVRGWLAVKRVRGEAFLICSKRKKYEVNTKTIDVDGTCTYRVYQQITCARVRACQMSVCWPPWRMQIEDSRSGTCRVQNCKRAWFRTYINVYKGKSGGRQGRVNIFM